MAGTAAQHQREAASAEGGAQPVSVDRRQKMLDAALDLFAVRGFDGVSIRDITNAAGVNVALLYHYFGDKRSLYEFVLQSALQQEVEPQILQLERDGPARDRLHDFVDNLIESILREDPRRKLLERMFIEPAWHDSPAIAAMRSRFQARMTDIIHELIPGGRDVPWSVISGVINAMPHAIVRNHRAEEGEAGPGPREHLADLLTEIIIAALGAAAGRIAADPR